MEREREREKKLGKYAGRVLTGSKTLHDRVKSFGYGTVYKQTWGTKSVVAVLFNVN